MRILIYTLLAVWSAVAQEAPANRLTFSGGWTRQIGGYSFEEKQTATGLGLSYGHRLHRYIEAEVGLFTALDPTGDVCGSFGCVDVDDHFFWVPFGVRFIAPLVSRPYRILWRWRRSLREIHSRRSVAWRRPLTPRWLGRVLCGIGRLCSGPFAAFLVERDAAVVSRESGVCSGPLVSDFRRDQRAVPVRGRHGVRILTARSPARNAAEPSLVFRDIRVAAAGERAARTIRSGMRVPANPLPPG